MWKGYLPTGGRDGKRPTEEYKDRTDFYKLEEVENLKSYGGVLKSDLIQIDIDNLDEEDDRVKSLANDYCRLRAIGFEGNIEGYGYVLEDSEVPLEARIGGLKKKKI